MGAEVSIGSSGSTLDSGVAAGAVKVDGIVGTAIASAGCNALGADVNVNKQRDNHST